MSSVAHTRLMRQGLLILGVAALLIAVTACGAEAPADSQTRQDGSSGRTGGVVSDYPEFESVADLAAASDAVVQGRVGPLLGREGDDGGSGDKAQEVPVAFYSLVVTQATGGIPELEPGDDLVIMTMDPAVATDNKEVIHEGQEVLAFIVRRDTRSAPGIDSQQVFFVPVGGGASLFDVADGTAVSRSESVVSLGRKGPFTDASDGPFVASLEDMWSTIATVRQ